MNLATTRRRFLGLLGAMFASSQVKGSPAANAQPSATSAPDSNNILWFEQPAPQWADALPVGNGRIGAMVFGGIRNERIALNEDTLWSGFPRDWNNPDAKSHLPIVRKLVLEQQDYTGADQELRHMQGPFNQAYQPLGDLTIELDHGEQVTGYRRELNLDTAVAKVTYEVEGNRYVRETFVSTPAQLVVVRLTSSKKGGLNGIIRLKSLLESKAEAIDDHTIHLTGKAPSESLPNYLPSKDPVRYSSVEGEGMHFAAVLRGQSSDGSIRRLEDGSLSIHGATSAVLLVSLSTGYRVYSVAPDLSLADVVKLANTPLERAGSAAYERLYTDHLADHHKLYRRVALDLGSENNSSSLPTDKRVVSFADKPDPALCALYFNFGRYLLLTSSRPGTQPANLQGIWNGELRPPWSSNWTSNINVQMNYWHAETCNLSECHQPLFDMVTDLSHNGAATAKANYGAKGWVSHHNIDLWRQSAPVGMGLPFADPTWANFCMSGPWLCAHFWEHYLFTGDQNFLIKSYPVMKGAAEFCLSWLVEDGNGKLTTCPSVSTENSFLAPNGKSASVSAGCTMDIALIRELFGNMIKATELLNTDHDLSVQLKATLQRLPEYQIGRYGQLQEWSVDFDENQPGQRHMSHLYPVYPGAEITPRTQPKLAAAARKSLERRLANGGAYTGWSRAWAIGLWARLLDGDMAWDSLKMLMQHSTGANLFDTHPASGGSIFQIDGNFGATAAIAEMLLQSHEDEISLLPALPKDWRSGHVRGLRARGGLEIDMHWNDGRLAQTEITALRSGHHNLRAPHGQKIVRATDISGASVSLHASGEPSLASLSVQAGKRYRLELAKI
jgi:alpha-L-fucosidase 2